MEQGRIRADAAQRSGQIQADRAARSGEIWSNALARAGQQISDIPRQKRERSRAKFEEARAARLDAQATREAQDRTAQDEALGSYGQPGTDKASILARLPGHLRVSVAKSIDDVDASALKLQEAQADYIARAAVGVKPFLSGPDGGKGALQAMFQHMKAQHIPDVDGLQQRIEQNPAAIPQVLDAMIARSPSLSKEMREANKPIEVSAGASLMDQSGKILGSVPPKPPSLQHVETASGIRAFNPESGTLGPVIAPGRPNAPPQPPSLQRVETAEGIRTFNPQTGQLGPVIGQPPPPAPQNQRLTKEERQNFAAWDYALPKLDGFTQYVQQNPDKWGKWDAFKQGLKQAAPGFADSDYASQEAFIGRINAEIRHALFGASLTEGEKESAQQFLVSKGDQPAVILAKVQEAANRARSNVTYYRDLGFNLPKTSGAAPGGASGAITVTAPNGKVYTFPNKADADAFRKRTGIR